MASKIYVVEDHPVMREAYALLFGTTPGLDLCGTAGSAEEALSKMDDLDCDLLLTDFRLPDLDGAGLVRRLRAARPDFPCIVVSAHADDVFVRMSLEAGAAAFVYKGDTMTDLVPTIFEVLQAHRAGLAEAHEG